jgi:hypothetical protein
LPLPTSRSCGVPAVSVPQSDLFVADDSIIVKPETKLKIFIFLFQFHFSFFFYAGTRKLQEGVSSREWETARRSQVER